MPLLKASTRFQNIRIVSGKRTALSNRQLTRRVRTLTGKEGRRLTVGQNLYDGVTLVANTADINYMTTLNSLSNHIIHKVRFFVRWQSIINSLNRLIVFEDTRPSQGDAAVAQILAVTTDPFSSYVLDPESVHPFSAKRGDKNLETVSRVRILKDFMWTDAEPVAGVDVIKAMKFDVNFRGRKSDSDLSWGLLIMADQANTPIDIQYIVDATNLNQ